MGKVLIFSAPSGSGKTTIVRHLLSVNPTLRFSVSATSRTARKGERDGVDYYFLSSEQFSDAIGEGRFIEWQEVYSGTCYGTLRSEVERIWEQGNVVVFDVDVVGGVNLKRIFGSDALSVFVMPPSIEELGHRLTTRATDSEQAIERRLNKAEAEIGYAEQFDSIIINDKLDVALCQAQQTITTFLGH